MPFLRRFGGEGRGLRQVVSEVAPQQSGLTPPDSEAVIRRLERASTRLHDRGISLPSGRSSWEPTTRESGRSSAPNAATKPTSNSRMTPDEGGAQDGTAATPACPRVTARSLSRSAHSTRADDSRHRSPRGYPRPREVRIPAAPGCSERTSIFVGGSKPLPAHLESLTPMKFLGGALILLGLWAAINGGAFVITGISAALGLLFLAPGFTRRRRRCPYCGGLIRQRAKTCRHCRSRLLA